jgi:hypothetical protein
MYLIQTFKIIIISRHYYYVLYVCTCEFLLHQESFAIILVDTRHFVMGVLQCTPPVLWELEILLFYHLGDVLVLHQFTYATVTKVQQRTSDSGGPIKTGT